MLGVRPGGLALAKDSRDGIGPCQKTGKYLQLRY